MLGMLIFANVVQALCARFVFKEGGVATIAAMIGLKPLVDGFNIIFVGEENHSHGSGMGPAVRFA